MSGVQLSNRMTFAAALRALCAALPLLLIDSGCQRPATPQSESGRPVRFVREEWIFGPAKGAKLTSDHYVLYTTCTSKPLVDAMPGFLESCFLAYREVLPGEIPPDRKLDTYLFQSRWHWEKFTEQFSPQRAETYKKIRAGGYSERGVTISHYTGHRTSLSILAHEGFHQFAEATRGSNIPAWLNEGLACYFEAFDLDPRANRPLFRPETNHLRMRSLRNACTAKELIPLERILGTHAGIEVQERSAHVRSYYAQVWSLVLFLNRSDYSNAYRERFQALLREVGTEAMDCRTRAYLAENPDGNLSYGEAVFRAYIEDDLAKFQQAYDKYLQELLGLAA